MESLKKLEQAGSRIAEWQNRELAETPGAPVEDRVRLLQRALRTRKAMRQRLAMVAAALLGMVAIVGFAIRGSNPDALAFQIGGQKPSNPIGASISATEVQVPILFADGTSLRLEKESRARVLTSRVREAKVALERGAMHVRVVHRDGAQWTIVAGPFELHVTGTEFDAKWNPATEALVVSMIEGRVLITGECLGGARPLVAGEAGTFRCVETNGAAGLAAPPSIRESSDVPQAVPTAVASSSTVLEAARDRDRHGVPPESVAPPDVVTDKADAGSKTWNELARSGRYAEAVQMAERSGFDRILAQGHPKDLLELGTASRLARRYELANRALKSIRSRFAGSDSSTEAAFHLGQIAFDSTGNLSDARHWFKMYLEERPQGPLAKESLGRLLDAEDKLGDRESAAATAAKYLRAYPNGPYAARAKQLVYP